MPGHTNNELASEAHSVKLNRALQFLSPREITLIDQMLSEVGDFGEVQLTVKNGRLRFVAHTKSIDALKWQRVEVE